MKKIILALFAGALAFTTAAFAQEEMPQILYNSEIYIQSDSIRNINGRVMIPFREIFETMGAEVEYENGKVTAVRGDKTVEFMVDGNIITVKDKDIKKEIVTDIGFDVENERVLVPVRFVSQAMGASVGWEDSMKTVIISDIEPYINSLIENCPDFYQYIQKTKELKTNISSSVDMSLGMGVDYPAEDIAVKGDIKAAVKSEIFNKNAKGNFSLDISIQGLDELTGMTIMPVEDVTFDMLKDSDTIYIKSNIVEKLKEMIPDNEQIAQAAEFWKSDNWISIDRNYIAENMNDVFADMIFEEMQDIDFSETLKEVLTPKMDIDMAYAIYVSSYFNMLETVYKDFVFTETGDNSYTLSFEWDTDNFVVCAVNPEWYETEDEYKAELEQIKQMFDITLTSYTEVKDGVAVSSDTKMNFEVNDEDTAFYIVMDVLQKTQELQENIEIEKPEDAISLEMLLDMFATDSDGTVAEI